MSAGDIDFRDYPKDAPLTERLQWWVRDIDDNYGWYEISDDAAQLLRADVAGALEALGVIPPENKER
jgi:hypothetical protein